MISSDDAGAVADAGAVGSGSEYKYVLHLYERLYAHVHGTGHEHGHLYLRVWTDFVERGSHSDSHDSHVCRSGLGLITGGLVEGAIWMRFPWSPSRTQPPNPSGLIQLKRNSIYISVVSIIIFHFHFRPNTTTTIKTTKMRI